jgi:GNAT superfamily N-acetyltransferase
MGKLDDKDRYRRRMFEDTNRIRFEVDIGDDDREWWLTSIYDPFALTPEDVADRLSSSWTGDKSIVVTELSGATQRFGASVSGAFGAGKIWILQRTLDFRGTFLNAERMFIDESRQGGGIGRRFMADAVALATTLGLDRVTLEADNIGRYAWLRCGFLPDRGAWTRMRPEIITRIAGAADELTPDRFMTILGMARNENPIAARELAALTDSVTSTTLFDANAHPIAVPLGRALFLEASPPWAGSLDLSDSVSMDVLDHYLGSDGE